MQQGVRVILNLSPTVDERNIKEFQCRTRDDQKTMEETLDMVPDENHCGGEPRELAEVPGKVKAF